MVSDQGEQVKMLVRMDWELKQWIALESERTGRSQTWLVNHALTLWKDRLEKSRKSV